MQKITTFLTYNDQAEEAAKLYTSLIKNSSIKNVSRYTDAVPGQGGKVMTVQFELAGQDYVAMNGGPSFKFAEGVSLLVSCETQAEIDQLWDRLTANGGKPGPCGWLTDRFGVSWQIVPSVLSQLMTGPDRAGAERATKAMLGMSKLDIAALQRAYDGKAEVARR
jgi:predicted 3-demethylubiquinone-9 3-methyltransferase (glyoxalase superfamily)